MRFLSRGNSLVVLCALTLFILSSPFMQEAFAAAAAKSQEAPKSQNEVVGPVTQAAVQAGVLSSASRINQVCNFLTAGDPSGAFLFVPNIQPDRKIFSTSLEILKPDSSPVYASASFASSPEAGSNAVYDAVEYKDVGCVDLEKTTYKGLKRVGMLKKNITMLDAGAVKIFLMPAGKGCVIIKKEVVQ